MQEKELYRPPETIFDLPRQEQAILANAIPIALRTKFFLPESYCDGDMFTHYDRDTDTRHQLRLPRNQIDYLNRCIIEDYFPLGHETKIYLVIDLYSENTEQMYRAPIECSIAKEHEDPITTDELPLNIDPRIAVGTLAIFAGISTALRFEEVREAIRRILGG